MATPLLDSEMESLNQAEELFHLALQARGDTSQFLKRNCGSDKELYDIVLSLVRSSFQDSGAILNRPLSVGSSLRGQSVVDCVKFGLPGCGDRIFNYEIIRPLGKGGMGIVLLAKEIAPIQRLVALKLMTSRPDDPIALNRIAVERQTLAVLNHPSIPTIYNAGITDAGQSFLVLEYIDGLSIVQYCRQHQVDLQQRLSLFLQLCSTVRHVHQCGFVHRDIKSGNVLVSGSGADASTRLVDFGIAKHLVRNESDVPLPDQARSTQTQHGEVLGTPGCMSPEQYLPGFGAVDHRTDIYAMGLLLYKLLTNVTPFETSRVMAADQIKLLESPVPPSAKMIETSCSTLSNGLDHLILKCIKLAPGDRFQSVCEVQEAVSELIVNAEARRNSVECGQAQVAKPKRPTLAHMAFPNVDQKRGSLSIRAQGVIASLVIVACFFTLNLNNGSMGRFTSFESPAVAQATASAIEDRLKTIEVDDETYLRIAEILRERSNSNPSNQMPRNEVVATIAPGEAITIARSSAELPIPVASDANARDAQLASHSG